MGLLNIVKKSFRTALFVAGSLLLYFNAGCFLKHLPEDRQAYLDEMKQRIEVVDKKSVDDLETTVEDLLDDMEQSRFERFKKATTQAYEELGITHAHRYSLELLSEALWNWESKTYNQDKDLAVFFLNRSDHNGAYSYNAYRIIDFTEGYKVLLFEVSDLRQIKARMGGMKAKFFPSQKIAGLVVGGHGSTYTSSLGRHTNIYIDDVAETFYPFLDMFTDDAEIILPNCDNGKGEEEKLNLVNAVAEVFLNHRITGCNTTCIGIEYNLDNDGKLVPGSVRLPGLIGGFFPSWFVPWGSKITTYSTVLTENKLTELQRKFRELCEKGVLNLRSGLKNLDFYSVDDIASYYDYCKKNNKNFSKYCMLETGSKNEIPIKTIIEYNEAGIEIDSILENYFKKGIEPEFIKKAKEEGIEDENKIIELYESKKSKKPQHLNIP